MFKRLTSSLGLTLTLLAASPALAQVNPVFVYHGFLTNELNDPVSASYSIEFAVYDQPSGGSPLWTETVSAMVENGNLIAHLGSGTAFPAGLFETSPLYLAMKIGTEELPNRQRIGWVPLAMLAEDTRTLGGAALNLSGCSDGQVLTRTSAGWGCSTVSGGGSFVAGSGIKITGSTISLADCAAGQVLQHNGASWACTTLSAGQTYLAGSGLKLTGATFSLTDSCGDGSVLKSSGGSWSCSTDDPGPVYGVLADKGLVKQGNDFGLVACSANEGLLYDGSKWACGNHPALPPNPGTNGRLLYDNGTSWTALGAGSAGQTLAVGSGGAPEWSAANAHDHGGQTWNVSGVNTALRINASIGGLVVQTPGVATSAISALQTGTQGKTRAIHAEISSASTLSPNDVAAAVYAESNATSGNAFAGEFIVNSPDGTGLRVTGGSAAIRARTEVPGAKGLVAYSSPIFTSSLPMAGVVASAQNGSNAIGLFASTETLSLPSDSQIARSTAVAAHSSGDVFVGYSLGYTRTFRVHSSGTVHGASYNTSNIDLAERVAVSEELEPGDVVEIDPARRETFRRAREPFSTRAAGIVSTKPGVLLGHVDAEEADNEARPPLALAGRVPVKACADGEPIRIGDLLTTSPVPGHAMRCPDRLRCAGAIVGKALEPLEAGCGRIVALVTLQ